MIVDCRLQIVDSGFRIEDSDNNYWLTGQLVNWLTGQLLRHFPKHILQAPAFALQRNDVELISQRQFQQSLF